MRLILFPLVAAGALAAYPIVAQTTDPAPPTTAPTTSAPSTSQPPTSQPDTSVPPAGQADNAAAPSAYAATPDASNASGDHSAHADKARKKARGETTTR